LFQATQNARWLKVSLELAERTLLEFWDEERGGFFFTPSDGEQLIVRRKDLQDGAVPSGMAIATLNLARLGRLLARPDYLERARDAAASVALSVARYPTAHTVLLSSLRHLESDGGEVVVVGSASDPLTDEMLGLAQSGFNPERLVVYIDADLDQNPLFEISPHFSEYRLLEGKPTVYVCENFTCQVPTTSLEVLAEQLTP